MTPETDDRRRFGYEADAWEGMVHHGTGYLERVCASGRTTDYTTFCAELGKRVGHCPQPGDHSLTYLLGDIGRRSYDERGVVITAVVHYKGAGYNPGPGFFTLCQELGLLPSGSLPDRQKDEFLVRHHNELQAAYGDRRRRR